MTAAKVFEAVTSVGATDFAELVRILDENKPWCLIDGLAVNCYVEPVYTIDADIVLVIDQWQKNSDELERVSFTIQKFEHLINAKRKNSQLNVQFTTDVRYQEFLTKTEQHEVLGQQVPVAILENIVHSKVWAWNDQSRRASKRKKDELDLPRIAEAYSELRDKIPGEIVEQLK